MKIESVKNRTVCSNMYQTYTYGTPKILKFLDVSNLSINHLQKELTKYHSPIKNGSKSRER